MERNTSVNETLNGGYRMIFWGLLLSLVHINLGALQILPGFVCFFIVASGLKKLEEASPCKEFQWARGVCVAYAIYGIFTFALDLFGAESGNSPAMLVLMLITYSFNVVIFFFLLTGSARLLAEEAGLSHWYKKRAKVYVSLYSIDFIGILFGTALYLQTAAMLLLAIAAMVLQLWLLVLIAGLRRRFPLAENAEPGQWESREDGESGFQDEETAVARPWGGAEPPQS